MPSRTVQGSVSLKASTGAVVMLVLAAALAQGCGLHQVRGVVLPGETAAVLLVPSDDPRLEREGVPNVMLRAVVDPQAMKPTRVDGVMTDAQGRFSVPVAKLGAGFLEYSIQLWAYRDGYQPATGSVAVPGSGMRLLVIMPPGQNTYRPPPPDFLQETLDQSRQLGGQ